MTEQELIEYGYKPEECKIGTLYFRSPFFINLKDGVARVYSINDDNNPLGEATTIEEVKRLESDQHLQMFKYHRFVSNAFFGFLKDDYEGIQLDLKDLFCNELEAFRKANNTWYESNFDPAVDREQIFLDALTETIYNADLVGKLYRGE